MDNNLKIEIDLEKCTGCKECLKTCFADVYRWDDIEEKPVVAYIEDCCGCMVCELDCPGSAIEVVVPSMPKPQQTGEKAFTNMGVVSISL